MLKSSSPNRWSFAKTRELAKTMWVVVKVGVDIWRYFH
jgi:hypothetical protein